MVRLTNMVKVNITHIQSPRIYDGQWYAKPNIFWKTAPSPWAPSHRFPKQRKNLSHWQWPQGSWDQNECGSKLFVHYRSRTICICSDSGIFVKQHAALQIEPQLRAFRQKEQSITLPPLIIFESFLNIHKALALIQLPPLFWLWHLWNVH